MIGSPHTRKLKPECLLSAGVRDWTEVWNLSQSDPQLQSADCQNASCGTRIVSIIPVYQDFRIELPQPNPRVPHVLGPVKTTCIFQLGSTQQVFFFHSSILGPQVQAIPGSLCPGTSVRLPVWILTISWLQLGIRLGLVLHLSSVPGPSWQPSDCRHLGFNFLVQGEPETMY